MMRAKWWFGAALMLAVGFPADRFLASGSVLLAGQSDEVARDPYRVGLFCTPLLPPAGGRSRYRTARNSSGRSIAPSAATRFCCRGRATFRPTRREGSFMLRNRRIPAGAVGDDSLRASGIRCRRRRCRRRSASIRSNQNLMPKIRATATNIPVHPRRGPGARLSPDRPGHRHRRRASPSSRTSSSSAPATTRPSNVEPSDIVIDRCYVHGNDVGELPARRRDERHPPGGDRFVLSRTFTTRTATRRRSPAGTVPGRSRSSTTSSRRPARTSCSAAAIPTIAELVPSDIEIRRNLMHQAAGVARAPAFAVKNAFELKNARRVLVEGNVFEQRVDLGPGRHRDRAEVGQPGRRAAPGA